MRLRSQACGKKQASKIELAVVKFELVVDLHPIAIGPDGKQARRQLSHPVPLQDLVGHVHQVFVHERIVAIDLAVSSYDQP